MEVFEIEYSRLGERPEKYGLQRKVHTQAFFDKFIFSRAVVVVNVGQRFHVFAENNQATGSSSGIDTNKILTKIETTLETERTSSRSNQLCNTR